MELWKNDLSILFLSDSFIFYKFGWNLQLSFLILWNNCLVSTSMCSNSTACIIIIQSPCEYWEQSTEWQEERRIMFINEETDAKISEWQSGPKHSN